MFFQWSIFDSGVDEAITVCAEEDDEDNENVNVKGTSINLLKLLLKQKK